MFWIRKLFEEKFDVMVLLFLLLLLMVGDAMMVWANRPVESLRWLQGLITGVFTALLAKLGTKTADKT